MKSLTLSSLFVSSVSKFFNRNRPTKSSTADAGWTIVLILICVTLLSLFGSERVSGQVKINPAQGSLSDEPIIPSAQNPVNSTVRQLNTFYAYVGPGENLDVTFTMFELAAGATDMTITIRGPGGVVQTCTHAVSVPVGSVCSRTNLTAATPGVWQIDFTAAAATTNRYNWVINVQSGTTNIPGRVYSEQYIMAQIVATVTPSMAFWYVTDRGFRYSAVYRGYNGIDSTLRSDSVGVRFNGTCNSAYQSSGEGAPAGTSVTTIGECGDPYKIFFEAPAADLPATATLWDGSTDWIAPPLVAPVLSNVAFTPDSSTIRSGTISFDLTNFTGPVTVQIDTNNNGVFNGPEDVTVTGFADNGTGTAPFDGIDGLGNPMPVVRTIGVRVSVDRAGEIHFFNQDVEMRSGGLEVVALNGPAAGSDILFWNDTQFTTAGRCSLTPLTNGTSGVSSSGGVHGWGPGTCTNGTIGSTWGNNRTIDDWTFQPLNLVQTIVVPGTPTSANVSISGRVMTAHGRGLPRATVILTDMNGISRTATTSVFGYFRFDDVQVGETYILTAVAKGYHFEQQTISVLDEMSDLNLVALE